MNKKEIKTSFKALEKDLKKEYREIKIQVARDYREKRNECRAEYRSCREQIATEYDSAINAYYLEHGVKPPVDPPKRGLLEEIGNSVTHGVGAIFSVFAFVFMLLACDSAIEYVSACVYFVGLFTMFSMSCLYHAFHHGSAVKRLFHRFDYTGIYLLIGATFTPPLLCFVSGGFGITFSAIQWAIIIAGIVFISVFGPTRFKFIHIPLYLVLGWSALILLPRLMRLSFPLAMWILGGGIAYTLGVIPFMMKSKVSHFVWHFFVLAGAVVQWVGIYLYIFLK